MVSSFRNTNEVLQVYRGSGVITDWNQSCVSLLVGGDSRMIRVWNAHTESQVMDITTNSESSVAAIVSDEGLTLRRRVNTGQLRRWHVKTEWLFLVWIMVK